MKIPITRARRSNLTGGKKLPPFGNPKVQKYFGYPRVKLTIKNLKTKKRLFSQAITNSSIGGIGMGVDLRSKLGVSSRKS